MIHSPVRIKSKLTVVNHPMVLTLEAKALECVRGGRILFQGLDFSLAGGEFLEVRGPNGSGKTSLLRMLCGLLAPAAGEILWRGTHISELKEEYFSEMAYLGHANGVKAELTAIENLRIHAGLTNKRADGEVIGAALTRVGLGGSEAAPAKTLSQGQQRRLALARLLVGSKPLWILDEPLAALDSAAISLFQSVLGEHLNEGGMAVLTTHQPLAVSAGRARRVHLAPLSEH